MIKCVTKYAVIFYMAQAFIGIGVGVYLAATLNPAEIERMVSCVTH